jgi:hypothetical protein
VLGSCQHGYIPRGNSRRKFGDQSTALDPTILDKDGIYRKEGPAQCSLNATPWPRDQEGKSKPGIS